MRSASAGAGGQQSYSLAPIRTGIRARPLFRVLVGAYLLLFIFGFGDPTLTRLESLAAIMLVVCVIPYGIGAGRGHILLPLPFLLLFGLMVYFWLNLLYHQDMAVRWDVNSAQYQRLVTAMISVCASYAVFLYLAIFRDFSFFFKFVFVCLIAAILLTILGGQPGATAAERAGGTLGGVNRFASSLAAMSALFLVPFAWEVSRRAGGNIAMFAVFALLVLGLILNILYTGSRQGMLITGSMLLVAILAASSRMLHRPGVLVLPLAIAVFGTVAIMFDLFDLSTNRYVVRLLNLVSFFKGEELLTNEGSVFERALMIELGLDLWRQRPLVGYGMDSFRFIGGFGTYSHNNFVDLLVGGGALALGIYVLAHLAVMARFTLDRNSPGLVRAVGSFAVLVLLLTGFTIVTYYSRAHLICFGVLAALPYASPRPLTGAR
jgi:hypothetical protein